MSALAQLLASRGARVFGSDRSFDRRETPNKFAALKEQGIVLCPQDGTGVTADTGVLVVSTAVEDSVPDVRAAKNHGIPIRRRAEILADVFAAHTVRIAIGGTSGKSTVTGMLGHILQKLEKDPTVIGGAVTLGAASSGGLGNVIAGSGDICVIEADESDGSIELYHPSVSVLTNLTLDHLPMERLRELFSIFLERSDHAIVNIDDPGSEALCSACGNLVTFSLGKSNADICATEFEPKAKGCSFLLDGTAVELSVPGQHNVSNALAAIAACGTMGINPVVAARALSCFPGMKRRLETAGSANGITVIDDFAHNPDKISASLACLKEFSGRVIVIYQPHGFAPTRLCRGGLIDAFAEGLDREDILIMPEIYYAGGSAAKDISSMELVEEISARGINSHYIQGRDAISDFVLGECRQGDRIIVMGARDDTLSVFARNILDGIRAAHASGS
jgi:UDP-N-acetylmuramate--alanine ligase